MKLLFCYDGPIEKDEFGDYYSTALTDEMFSRYECISNEITIVIRVNHTKKELLNDKYMPLSKDKYNIVECPSIASIKGLLFNKRECYRIIGKCIKEADAIIIRLPSFLGNIAFRLSEKEKKPYLIELVGCAWGALWNYNFKGKIIAPFMKMATKNALKKTNYAVYVSNEFLQKEYPTNGQSIACSNVILKTVDDDIIKKRYEKIKNFNFSKKIVIGTLGAIDIKYKGHEYVIHAIKLLTKMGYNVEYQIVGNGSSHRLDTISKKYGVSNSVNILGPMKHEDVFTWIDNLDIYIQPSNTEGLCRAIIEAMSRGCPVIASDVGGNPELIDNNFIFKKKKYKELCNCILKMDKETMFKQAELNFNNSKTYLNVVLSSRRTEFLKKYAKGIKNNKG